MTTPQDPTARNERDARAELIDCNDCGCSSHLLQLCGGCPRRSIALLAMREQAARDEEGVPATWLEHALFYLACGFGLCVLGGLLAYAFGGAK